MVRGIRATACTDVVNRYQQCGTNTITKALALPLMATSRSNNPTVDTSS